MALPRWALPEHFEDVLPQSAARIERLRRLLLDEFRLHGYQLVIPPSVEFLDSLASGTGADMADAMYKFVDQYSGRTMALRADTTPQVTRIDAHLLNRSGVTRLCYCGPVVHVEPRSMSASREPLQVGAELYGHAGIEADVEVLRLLARTLQLAGTRSSRIDVGHVGIFRALSAMAGLGGEAERTLFRILQAKDVPALKDFVAGLAEPARSALMILPELYGNANVLVRARSLLPDVAGVREALDQMLHLAKHLGEQPLSFDLADLRGYHYHSGLMFAAYCGNSPTALALGGRYDAVGAAFGRPRPATGFSLDLRELAALSVTAGEAGAILAPQEEDPALQDCIAALRAAGEVVMLALPGHRGCWREAGCDRQIIKQDNAWGVVPLQD
ncbi:MAG: ATP phosphoribosyltransferase regulatory subunit [Candidatus Dactylopiibacterium carminicum]|uniref:ATP phosphoribosyltransferase regulatory subunit n=1 Tax=Candidatus Dactylopiibacterium carminicum TaxID=857335 RepID=A0A272F0I5_9RHOO|nr:ATP phosphoribosyltransferase regulatory subunit [Candidatus Dactylopiibacterium carminicum]KAF7600881.1 ATP phosphoribosyltransferase regulatory subunit [Candidatus Dactylopiibacterium carminicum]PAS95380.1 MAG: ATP phosphoribosyltransferase regulatory subunit [Candidatus Dactylopiibacterium carminicum]PAS98609.1 MAG: ATP phosphoribosyltransferase regulatory subunit [Candidatus Dactylopiibacterium carminicum]PAT00880.1 MAG: ATP phosphoribosyltransferase regulatory subunit [Candidatus Dactyl